MDFRQFNSLAKESKTAAAIIKALSKKLRRPKGGVIDLAHFRSKVRSSPGFNHQDYEAFWKSLAKYGLGEYIPASKTGEHPRFIVSDSLMDFAKMATGQIPTTVKQERYNMENSASAAVEGPVFQIATLLMSNLKHMSSKEVEFLRTILENKAQLS